MSALTFSPQPTHQAFEPLPLPVIVIRDGKLVYVNAAGCAFIGLEPSALLGVDARTLLSRMLRPYDERYFDELLAFEGLPAGPAIDSERVLAARSTRGEVQVKVLVWPGVHATDRVLAFLAEDAADQSAQALAQKLSAGAAALLHSESEEALLEAALDVLASHQFTCGILFADGEVVRGGPMRQPAELTQAFEAAYGGVMPTPETAVFPLSALPHLVRVAETRRAVFHQDMVAYGSVTMPPQVYERFLPLLGNLKGLDAPLYVGEQLYGFLGVQSLALTPSAVGAIELFARILGAALENVRQHQSARGRLVEMQRLQDQLIAAERFSALGETSATVAKEMARPLEAIGREMALLTASTPDARAALLQRVESEARRLERLARDMLAWARPLSIEFRPLSVSTLVVEAVTKALVPDGRLLVLDCDATLQLRGDGEQLQRGLAYLIRHVLETAPADSQVKLWTERAQPDGRHTIVLVVDGTGGAPRETLTSRHLQPFMEQDVPGSGLALALSARLFRAHGGEVRIFEGTPSEVRFEVQLPLSGDD